MIRGKNVSHWAKELHSELEACQFKLKSARASFATHLHATLPLTFKLKEEIDIG